MECSVDVISKIGPQAMVRLYRTRIVCVPYGSETLAAKLYTSWYTRSEQVMSDTNYSHYEK